MLRVLQVDFGGWEQLAGRLVGWLAVGLRSANIGTTPSGARFYSFTQSHVKRMNFATSGLSLLAESGGGLGQDLRRFVQIASEYVPSRLPHKMVLWVATATSTRLHYPKLLQSHVSTMCCLSGRGTERWRGDQWCVNQWWSL